jgi:hypothetical protein
MFPIKPMPEINNSDPRATESRQQNASQKLIAFAFGKIVSLWPADSRDWALAMQAELPQMESTQESLNWLSGGIMSLGKAWWNKLIYGGNPHEAAPAKLPGVATAILLLLAISSFALPGMRQGMVAIFDTWNFSYSYLGSAQLQKMGNVAEQNRDASTLAFVAMRLPANSPGKVRWANLAVSLDPSLTWVYFQMEDERQRPDANFSERVARLQKWDPANAVPYLMEAQQSFESFASTQDGVPAQWITFRDYKDYEREITKHPEWSSVMEKAFRSPHFNDYQNERFNLNLAIQRKFGMNRPVDLVFSTFATRIPNLLNVRSYATWLNFSGAQRETAGDNSGAAEDYWRAAHFGQRMNLESSPDGVERLIAISILKSSFEKLKSLYEKTGRADEAKYAAFELENATAAVIAFRENNWRLAEATSLPSWSALMIHIASLLILVAALLSCVALLWLALRISGTPVSRLTSHRNACAIARIAPVLLVLSLGLFYANYFPYLRSFNEASPRFAQHLTSTFGGLLKVPFSFSQFWTYGHGEVYFWTGALAMGCAAVLILLIRMPARGKMEKQIA